VHHAFLDQYSDLSSPIHTWDARLKSIACILIVICIVSLPPGRFVALFVYLTVLLSSWYASHVPARHLLKRLAYLMPFVLIMSLSFVWTKYRAYDEHALTLCVFIILRAFAAIMALTLLTSTTHFPTLLSALQWMRIPKILLSLLSFMYRFTFILIDEFERLKIGRASRELGHNIKLAWKSRAWMLGTFLIRSVERSERVYRAMLARGFQGEMKHIFSDEAIERNELLISVFIFLSLILVRIGVMR